MRDRILDFEEGDLIDLSAIDANANAAGDQAFVFANFVFTGVAGELVRSLRVDGVLVQGDVNGDAQADFAILLTGAPFITGSDFIL